MADQKYLLDLSTLEPDRPLVKIDGKTYEMAIPDDFGIREMARLRKMGRRIQALEGQDELADEELDELAHALDECCAMALPGCPDEVRAKLTDTQKAKVVRAFGERVAEEGMATAPEPRPPRK